MSLLSSYPSFLSLLSFWLYWWKEEIERLFLRYTNIEWVLQSRCLYRRKGNHRNLLMMLLIRQWMLWLDYLSIKQISNLFSCFLLSFKSFSLHSHSYLSSFLSTHSFSSSLFFTFTSFSSTSFYSHSIIPNQNTPISITIHNNHSSINSIHLSISLFHSSFSTISIITELLFV